MKRRIPTLFFLWLFLCLDLCAQPSAKDIVSKRVQFTMQFTMQASADAKQVSFTAWVPRTIEGRQKILSLKYSLPPTKEFEDNGNSYAHFFFNQLARKTVFKVEGEAELYGFDLALPAKIKPALEKPEALKKYLVHEKFLEKDAKDIQEAARKIKGQDEVEVIRNIMNFVTRTIKPGPFDPKDRGAVWALAQKKGDCTEFADLFVALCRAKGIPAKVCEGYVIHDLQRLDTPKHNWAEAYTAKHGWLPLDPMHVLAKIASFDRKRPYLYLSTARRDEQLSGFHYWVLSNEEGTVNVTDAFTIHRQENLPRK